SPWRPRFNRRAVRASQPADAGLSPRPRPEGPPTMCAPKPVPRRPASSWFPRSAWEPAAGRSASPLGAVRPRGPGRSVRHRGCPRGGWEPGPGRPAYTLLELLVVMGIILLLAALGYVLLPGMFKNYRRVSAVDQVSQWLLTARQRAKRDGVPTGLRLL